MVVALLTGQIPLLPAQAVFFAIRAGCAPRTSPISPAASSDAFLLLRFPPGGK